MIEVGIVGGSGYAGGELLRLLSYHPKVKIKFVTSERYKNLPVFFIHPNLKGINLSFNSINEIKEKVDLIFVALPNGVSMEYIDKLIKLSNKVIDLGADFRLESEKDWLYWYQKEHKNPKLLKKFVYGLPEIYREKIRKSSFVACPGCEATVSILALYPVIKENIIKENPIIIDAKMSSSQSGKNYSLSTHHPERAGCVRSYAPAGHRHTAEIEMVFKKINPKIKVDISATAIDMVRGILVTIHTFLKKETSLEEIKNIYKKHYQKEKFIRIISQNFGIYRYPEPKILTGTNFCEIGFAIDKRSNRLVIIAAIDNLTKGTAGQAVQCMNIMYNFEENLGLEFLGLHPI